MSAFIQVTKNGETIEIHPDALEDHKRLGWAVVDEAQPAQPEAPAVEAAPAPVKKGRGK